MTARDAFLRAAPAIKRIRPAFYNEHDPFAAAWLRELIAGGLIPAGDVDERSITEVSADDVRPYRQAHFFAGVGGWPYALRLAGWGDRAVWTGSPPCQPFSSAGRRRGSEDERHLAPVWLDLVRECRPPFLFGEQVASKPVLGPSKPARRLPGAAPEWAWFDDLRLHLEGSGYAVGASDLPAAGVGAPHIRARLFFGAVRAGGLAHSDEGERGRRAEADEGHKLDGETAGRVEGERDPAGGGDAGGVAGADGERRDGLEIHLRERGPRPAVSQAAGGGGVGRMADAGRAVDERRGGPAEASGAPREVEGEARQRERSGASDLAGGATGGVADADGGLAPDGDAERGGQHGREPQDGGAGGSGGGGGGRAWTDAAGDPARPCAPHGGWAAVDWLLCRDGKWRPAQPSLLGLAPRLPEGMVRGGSESSAASPLAEAAQARTGRLRGYGNAIVPQAAAEFIAAFEEASR